MMFPFNVPSIRIANAPILPRRSTRMCNSQQEIEKVQNEQDNMPQSSEAEEARMMAGPATQALKRAVDHETRVRASKRRRSTAGEDDSLARDAAQVSVEFNMAAVFAQLPTEHDAFPTISWDFEEVFATNRRSVAQRDSPLLSSLSTARATKGSDSSSSIKRSKSSETLDSLSSSKGTRSPSPTMDMDHPLGSEIRVSNDLVMQSKRRHHQQQPMESVSLKSLLKDTPMLAFSV